MTNNVSKYIYTGFAKVAVTSPDLLTITLGLANTLFSLPTQSQQIACDLPLYSYLLSLHSEHAMLIPA